MTVRFEPAGDQGLYVRFQQRIDPAVNRRARLLAQRLGEAEAASRGVREAIPSYAAVYVLFDPMRTSHDEVAELCAGLLEELDDRPEEALRVYRLPVAYGGEFGPDLEDVARHCGLSPDEVVAIHSGTDYFIYFLGFTPGFPFLGGLSPRIAAPRLPTPRTRVPAGSVGIAGEQTGVYPVDSPGGWRLIGRTPVPLYDPHRRPPVLLAAGHYVRFEPIDAATYARIEADCRAGRYQLAWEPYAGGEAS